MKRILVLGGTGRFGHAIIERLYSDIVKDVEQVGVLSRNKDKQIAMARKFPKVEFFECDLTSPDRLQDAMRGFDTVIHAAAMKDVVDCETRIEECVAVNFTATMNALKAAKSQGVKRFVYISTDMAVESASVYGHSKALADAAVVDAARDGSLCSCVVRFGNILTPQGSIFDTLHRKYIELGYVPVTHPDMSRFFMSSRQAADFVIESLEGRIDGGEIFAPICPSYDIMNVARAVAPDGEIRIVGLRAGDALSITMISPAEAMRTYRAEGRYVIFPQWCGDRYGEKVGFTSLTSASNPCRASVDELGQYCR